MSRNKWLSAGCIVASIGIGAVWLAGIPPQVRAEKVSKRAAPSEPLREAPVVRVAPPVVAVRAPAPPPAAAPLERQASNAQNGDDMWSLRLEALDSKPGPSQRLEDDVWVQFQKQPVDAKWSADAKQLITTDLSNLSQAAPFKLGRVECRQNMCVATLDFVDPIEAYRGFPGIASHRFGVPCTVSVTDDNPNDPAERSSLRVFFSECAKRS